jgi:hypothetical protein
MNEGGERGCCVLQFIKRLIKADFDGQASRRAVATGEDHPDIADVPRMHLRAIRMFFGLEKGQRISFSQFVRHAEQTAGGCPTSPGVGLGMPSLEGVRAMLLVQRFKSGFFDFYRLAAPLRAPAGRRATPCSLFFSTCLLPTSPLRFPC